LVVQSLLNGLRNRDDISELQRRLDSLPSDLDALYRHILQRIDPLYIAQASRIFQIFNAVPDLQIQTTILELDLAVTTTHANMMNPPEVTMSDQEILQRCDRMSAHLQTRCGGLLEVHDHRDRHWEAIEQMRRDYARQLPNNKKELQLKHIKKVKADLRVAYLHRTVRDFLAADSVRGILLDHTGPTAQFEPHTSLLMVYTLNLKSDVCSLHCTAPVSHEALTWIVVSEALLIAQKVDSPSISSMRVRDSILNEFSNMALRFANFPLSGQYALTSWSSRDWDAVFVSAAVKFQLTSFVEHILIKDSSLSQGPGGASLLAQALGYPIDLKLFDRSLNPIRDTRQPPSPSAVHLLL